MIDALAGRKWAVLQGDCRELLRGMVAESIDKGASRRV